MKTHKAVKSARSCQISNVFRSLAIAALLAAAPAQEAVEFDEAEIFFEFNSTDLDLGLQIFFDAPGWTDVQVVGPDGTVFQVSNDGGLALIGSTEVFTESAEPPLDENNLEAEIAAFLALFPEGEYEFSGTTVDGDPLEGSAELTHNLPQPVELQANSWSQIQWFPNGENLEITCYEIVAEMVVSDGEDDEQTFVNTATLPPEADSYIVSPTFVQTARNYLREGRLLEFKIELIVREESGNKTITETVLFEAEED